MKNNKEKDFSNFSFSDFKKYQNYILRQEKNTNSIFKDINFEKFEINQKKDSLLNNIPFAIKDNFAIKNDETSSSNNFLSKFKINFSSTVFEKLINSGSIPLFKTNLDELAMGGTGLYSNQGIIKNPFDEKKIIGGSSSGSAYLVAKEIVPFAIGSDTGDSIRKPAVYSNIIGFKPTWGIVSRYGLYDFSPSLDTVGWFTKNIDMSAKVLDTLVGYDEKDFSSIPSKEKNYFKDINISNKYKIGIIPNFLKDIEEKEILDEYNFFIEKMKKNGHEIIEINLEEELFKTLSIVYKIISSVDSFSCNSNLTGFLFGNDFSENKSNNYIEKITESRTKGFGYEVKKRFLLGIYASSISEIDYYSKAKKIRTLITKKMEEVFEKVDALIMPSHSSFTPTIKDVLNNKHEKDSIIENYLIIFNLIGSPSLSMQIKENNSKSISINISTKQFQDKKCLQISKQIENLIKGEKNE